MKKILLASTALLVGGMVSAQAAEPIKLSVGGFMKQQLIIADQKDYANAATVDQQGFGQVNFTGSTKLDNGITVGVAVETIASQWNDSRNASGARYADYGVSSTRAFGNSNVRRAYMTATSGYGQIIAGQREDFGFITGVTAPDVGWGLSGGDWPNFLTAPGGASSHAGNFDGNNSRYNNRSDKLTLVSPTLAGFTGGFTYVPDIRQSWTGDTTQGIKSDALLASGNINNLTETNANGLINRADFGGDMYLVGLAYKNNLGPVGINSNFAFGQYNFANMRTYQAGLQATYAGFTLGGSIFARNVGDSDHATVATGATGVLGTVALAPGGVYNTSVTRAIAHQGMNWDMGISYAFDAFAVSAGYFHDTTKRDANIGAPNYGGAADSTQVYSLAGKYTMGPGVEFRNSLYYVDYKNNSNFVANTVADKNATNNQGWAFVTGLQVAF